MNEALPTKQASPKPYAEALKSSKGKMDQTTIKRAVAFLDDELKNVPRLRKKMDLNTLTAQALLAQAGFDPGDLDDRWGKNTKEALKDFQEANGLDNDGVFGKQTLEKFKELFGMEHEKPAKRVRKIRKLKKRRQKQSAETVKELNNEIWGVQVPEGQKIYTREDAEKSWGSDKKTRGTHVPGGQRFYTDDYIKERRKNP
ncbi:peptidoglycan-binding protein [Patescibacteria group bacterium]|nr:peptidoglycan-binding protein [Patescibacteria group bacterium]